MRELQVELEKYRGVKSLEKVTYFEDTGRVNLLNQEVDRLKKTITDLNNEC